MEEEIKEEEIKKYVKELESIGKPTKDEIIVIIIFFIPFVVVAILLSITLKYFAVGYSFGFSTAIFLHLLALRNYQRKLAKIFTQKDRKISELENKLKRLTEQQLQEEVKRTKKEKSQ